MAMFNANMFGSRPLDMSGLNVQPLTFAEAGSQPRRRGLSGMLGGVVRGVSNAANGVVAERDPNFLDFLLGGQQRVDAMRQAPYQRDAQNYAQEERQHQRNDWQRQDQAQAAWDAYVSQLDPSQQETARLMGPQAWLERMRGGNFQGGPGFTNAYRINPVTGQVETGGALPIVPRSGGSRGRQNADPNAQLHALGGSWDD